MVFFYFFFFKDLDECLLFFCYYGVVCKNIKGSYLCLCSEGWLGKDCDEGILKL